LHEGVVVAETQEPMRAYPWPVLHAAGTGVDVGGAGRGVPPGPPAKLIHVLAACSPTLGVDQSHTPVGNVFCRVAHCASLNVTLYSERTMVRSWHCMTLFASGAPEAIRGFA
jgi:hypothetical protein